MVNIKVRLFASLRENRDKEIDMKFPQGVIVQDIIGKLKIQEKDATIILINGRGGNLSSNLKDKDILSIFPSIGGG